MDPREKIVESLLDLFLLCQAHRKAGAKIVLTSGCYDLLHGDHLAYLCEVSKIGHLVVGINSDKFVKRLKGEDRPIRGQVDRAFTIAGFEPVKLVTIFDCDYQLIEAVKPNFYTTSATSHLLIRDDKKRIDLLNYLGTQIVEIESKKTDSTTGIITRIMKAA